MTPYPSGSRNGSTWTSTRPGGRRRTHCSNRNRWLGARSAGYPTRKSALSTAVDRRSEGPLGDDSERPEHRIRPSEAGRRIGQTVAVCGIAGVVDRKGEQVDARPMIDVLRHRGPDSVGSFVGGRGAIGQSRLAIIDLVTGDPPIANEDRSIGAVLNGEIYNHRRLRRELRDAGHSFTTQCDTEVLAHLAEDSDAVCLAQRTDGM